MNAAHQRSSPVRHALADSNIVGESRNDPSSKYVQSRAASRPLDSLPRAAPDHGSIKSRCHSQGDLHASPLAAGRCPPLLPCKIGGADDDDKVAKKQEAKQKAAIDKIKELGGTFAIDQDAKVLKVKKPLVKVSLNNTLCKNGDLEVFKGLKTIEELELERHEDHQQRPPTSRT